MLNPASTSKTGLRLAYSKKSNPSVSLQQVGGQQKIAPVCFEDFTNSSNAFVSQQKGANPTMPTF